MKTRLLGLIALLALLAASQARATNITYTVDLTCTSCGEVTLLGPQNASLTGTITTNGTIGTLTAGNIVNVSNTSCGVSSGMLPTNKSSPLTVSSVRCDRLSDNTLFAGA